MSTTVGADHLRVGDVVGGRPIEALYPYGRHIAVRPHGITYHRIDSVVVDARAEEAPHA